MHAPQPFRDEHEHGVGRRGLDPRGVESRATISVANPTRLHGICPGGEHQSGGKFAAGVVSRMSVKPLSVVQSANTNAQIRTLSGGRRRGHRAPYGLS
jgi:hypothetical protein